MKRVRDDLGFTNVELMIPFVRTVSEAKRVVELLAEHGLERGDNGLRLIMMCEIPSNALCADEFLEHFDGFSIGSNDLTQLTLGLDRDSGLVAQGFDERDPAVKKLLSHVHLGVQPAGQVHRHLRPGPERPRRFCEMADGRRDPDHLAESGHGGGDVDAAGRLGVGVYGSGSGVNGVTQLSLLPSYLSYSRIAGNDDSAASCRRPGPDPSLQPGPCLPVRRPHAPQES